MGRVREQVGGFVNKYRGIATGCFVTGLINCFASHFFFLALTGFVIALYIYITINK